MSEPTSVSGDMNALLRQVEKEDGPEGVLRMLADFLSDEGRDVDPAFRRWLASRLLRIADGEPADVVLGTKRRRGDKSLPPTLRRRRLSIIAGFMAVNLWTLQEAAEHCAAIIGREASVLIKLARAHEIELTSFYLDYRAKIDARARRTAIWHNFAIEPFEPPPANRASAKDP
jgi:hypothetical protein